MAKKSVQLGLPLLGGGPTNAGYPSIFRPSPSPAPKQAVKAKAVLTVRRARWLLELYDGPSASSHGKVEQDCMAVGWTEWVKDGKGNYKEQLTPAGLSAIAHLTVGKRRPPA